MTLMTLVTLIDSAILVAPAVIAGSAAGWLIGEIVKRTR